MSDIVSYLHSAEEIPIDVLRQREAKWLEMLNSWDKWMAKKHKKVRNVLTVIWLNFFIMFYITANVKV